MTKPLVRKIRLTEGVLYTDSKGHVKPAIVIGTPESVVAGSSLQQLAENELNIQVFSPRRGTYARLNVPQGDGVRTTNFWSKLPAAEIVK